MQNYEEIFGVHVFCFRPEKHFLRKSTQTNLNCQFELKFDTKINLKMLKSIVMSAFSVFD